MRCDACKRQMRALFTSYACDHCDGLVPTDYYRGFIVLRAGEEVGTRPVYVFRTRTDAARWRAANDLRHQPLLEVLTEDPIPWRKSTGAIEDLELADRPFEIFADHRFEPGPYRAFLAPRRTRRLAS